MDEITKANVLKMQGRFSAIEVAIRVLIAQASNPAQLRAQIRADIEPTLTILAGTGNPDHVWVETAMRSGMDSLIDIA